MLAQCPTCKHSWHIKNQSKFKKCPNCGQKIEIEYRSSISSCLTWVVGLLALSFIFKGIQFAEEISGKNPLFYSGLIYATLVLIIAGVCFYNHRLTKKRKELEKQQEIELLQARENRERAYEEKKIRDIKTAKEQLFSLADEQIKEVKFLKTVAGKVNKLQKIQEIFEKTKDAYSFSDSDLLEIEERYQEISMLVSETKIEKLMEDGRKHEFTGNIKKALIAYKEALFTLQNDDVSDDAQREMIGRIKEKIDELEPSPR